MHLHKILSKDYLEKKLIQDKTPIMELALEVDCTKHMIIKYCKKHGIYEEVKRTSRSNREFNDLIEKEFGQIKVLERGTNDKFGKVRWKCKCSCGREKLINATSLLRGLTKSCGYCNRYSFKGLNDISGSYWRRLKFNASQRGFTFDITPEDIWDLYINQDKKCALSGIDIAFCRNQDKGRLQTASIDRMYSKIGYTKDNVQLVHKRIQRIKDIVPNDEFIFWCKLIYLNKKDYADTVIVDISNIGYHDK